MRNNNINNDILTEVAEYYTLKLSEYGETPLGVDWNGEESQVLRFEQLSKVIGHNNQFSINDLGCGYGALYEFLAKRYQSFSYSGFDVSQSMISAAQKRYANACFLVAHEPDADADFGVASGVFNVRLEQSDIDWKHYIEATLDILNKTSRLGFAFNCLTSYSDAHKMRDYLYYANPCELFDLCKRKYSRNVALIHDYELYEFTILVRK